MEWVQRRDRVAGIPGVLKCACGREVVIDCDGVECEGCGQPYNLFGQRLRKNWEYGEAGDYRNEGP
jgi:hypothetical protein